jgi:hypothetical protein
MPWYSKNYEKVALAGSAAVALGLAYFGWSSLNSVGQEFATTLRGAGNNNTAVDGADLIPKALQSMVLDRSWSQSVDGERPVDLFTGIPLFVSSNDPNKGIDLLRDAPLHPPIPNSWWFENRIDPGFAESPSQDPDADGFSNLEEFTAKTDPNNKNSIPPLIAKLMFVKDESLAWVIRPGYGSEGKFPFSYEDTKGRKNKVSAAEMIAPGGLFFAEPPMESRFKLLGSEIRKEYSQKTKAEMEVTIVRIEDQRPNKKGLVYELPSAFPEERKNEYSKYDRTAVLALEALGMEGREFKVEENTAFALPPENSNKNYLLKKVSPEAIVVEYPASDGSRKSIEIKKGQLPNFDG